MALVTPAGSLTVYPPQADGLATEFGLSRDWRMDKTWYRRNAEWIDPLKAIGPIGLYAPRAMALADWTFGAGYNNLLRVSKASGTATVPWMEFYDGAVHAVGSAVTDWWGFLYESGWASAYPPHYAIHLARQTPPPSQGVLPFLCVAVQDEEYVSGAWVAGQLALYLPLASDGGDTSNRYNGPLLHHIKWSDVTGGNYDIFTEGLILSEGPSGGSHSQGVSRETWLFEYVDDATRFTGSHILIRNTRDSSAWWHYYHDAIRVVPGATHSHASFAITVGGCVQAFSLTPITYGAWGSGSSMVATAWPPTAKPLPSGSGLIWHDGGATAPWGVVRSDATGWATTCAREAGGTQRPCVTFTRSSDPYITGEEHVRPVAWFATEQHDATIDNAVATTSLTEGTNRLQSLTYKIGRDFKGSGGSGTIAALNDYVFADWRENSKVVITLGWDAGAGTGYAATQVATAYIPPGGLPRSRDGQHRMGLPTLAVQFGDLFATRMTHKDIIDLRQAGGMTVHAWLDMLGNRLGLPHSMIDVDAAVTATVIPLADLPSLPNLAPNDGDAYGAHIAAVEQATGIRVGVDKTGTGHLFADAGRPAYVAGTSTITWELDYDTATEGEVIYRVQNESIAHEYRNCLKATYGPDNDRTTYYAVEALSDREAGIGDDWWRAMTDDDANASAHILAQFQKDHHNWAGMIVAECPLRPALRPDLFVRVSHVPDIALTTGTVYQILEVEHTLAAGDASDATRTKCLCQLVYTPPSGGMSFNGPSYNSRGFA